MGEKASLLNLFVNNHLEKKNIKRILNNNENRKNITHYEPSDIEAFIERDPQIGSYIISGGLEKYRVRSAVAVVACSLSQDIPTIVLHEGNELLQSDIELLTANYGNKDILTNSSFAYDPFYNRSNQEICHLIANSTGRQILIGALGQQYILGMAEFIERKAKRPYIDMFLRCPYDTLIDRINYDQQSGKLTVQEATVIRNQLIQGQNEQPNVQSFFSQLTYQGAGVLARKNNRSSLINIRETVNNHGLIMIDIGSSTNEILLNLIMNEIKEVLAHGKKVMLVLDGININANELLADIVKSLSSRCLITFLSDDAYSMLGSDDNLFHSFVGNACKCIVFSHSVGITCNKWSEVFGYYDEDKISRTAGNSQNFQWGYGTGTTHTINVTSERSPVVKPEEIARMPRNAVYILDRNLQELAYTTLR